MLRRILAILLLTVALGSMGATAQSTHGQTAQSRAAHPASAAKTAELAAKEKQLWETFGAKDAAAFGALLAPEYQYISDGGLTDAAELLRYVPLCDQRSYSFDHLQVLDAGKDSGVVLVHVKTDTVCGGEKTAPAFYAATTWVKRSGTWKVLVHTETDDPAPVPAPPAK